MAKVTSRKRDHVGPASGFRVSLRCVQWDVMIMLTAWSADAMRAVGMLGPAVCDMDGEWRGMVKHANRVLERRSFIERFWTIGRCEARVLGTCYIMRPFLIAVGRRRNI